MQLNTRHYHCLAIDLLDWVQSKSKTPCTRQDAGQDTKRKLRYTLIDTYKHLPIQYGIVPVTSYLSFYVELPSRLSRIPHGIIEIFNS